MHAALFGATGMIGQGVLRECLIDPSVTSVLVVGRRPTGQQHPKLREVVHRDFADFGPIADQLTGLDACLYCLGTSSAGLSEADYRRVTYDTALAVARTLLESNPAVAFLFVSGSGTDRHGRAMWARVKGETEEALLALPFARAYMFRPAFIQPRHGIRSPDWKLRTAYALFGPLYPLWKTLFPKYVTDTEEVGRAMVRVAREGTDERILECADIIRLGRAGQGAGFRTS